MDTIYHKKFDKELFDKNDPLGRKIVEKYFNKQGFIVEPYENEFQVDLVVKDKEGNIQCYVEVEIKHVWVENFSTVDVPYRKKEVVSRQMEHPVYVFLIVNELSEAIVFTQKDVYDSFIRDKDTYNGGMNTFYEVPKDKIFKRIIFSKYDLDM